MCIKRKRERERGWDPIFYLQYTYTYIYILYICMCRERERKRDLGSHLLSSRIKMFLCTLSRVYSERWAKRKQISGE